MTRPSGQAVLRPLVVADITLLSAELPRLLPGHWTAAGWEILLASDHILRVLACDGTVVGFAEYQQVLDEGHLLGIAVLPQFQGQGLGRTFLDALLRDMRQSGCARCLLEVRVSNRPAVRLYEGAGFRLDGRRKGYYPASDGKTAEDALLYSRALKP